MCVWYRNVDLIELRKQLEAGNVRAMGAVTPIMAEAGDLSALQRPFVKKWMKPVDYDEVRLTHSRRRRPLCSLLSPPTLILCRLP